MSKLSFPLPTPLFFQENSDFQRDLEGEAEFGVFERVAQEFFDAAQAVEQRVAVQVHCASGLAEVAITAKEAFQCFQERLIATIVGIQQGAKRLLVEVEQSLLAVEREEQAIDPQAGERVEFALTKEPAANLQCLLRLAPGLRNGLDVSGDLSNAA